MQTFLPYPDFHESARVLDRQRLGKQRVEAWQIVRTLTGQSAGWRHHPAVKMWEGHGPALVTYGIAMCEEWIGRGYKDTLLERFQAIVAPGWPIHLPAWIGDEALHASHRANLLRKDPAWYGAFGWTEDPTAPYVWPAPAQAA